MTDSTATVKPTRGAVAEPPAPAGAADDRFETFREQLVEPDLLAELRTGAWERFQAAPFPTKKSEEWRYTDPATLGLDDLIPTSPSWLTRSCSPARPRGASWAGPFPGKRGS